MQSRVRTWSIEVLFHVFVLVIVALALIASPPAGAALTYSWTGSAGNNFANPNNWNPVGTPAAGDALAFPQGPNVRNLVNDLPAGRSFAGLFLNGSGYVISGNAVAITQTVAAVSTGTLDLPIDIGTNAVTFTGNLTFGTNTILSGSGTITSNGTVTFNGTMAGTFSYTNNNWLALRGGVHSHTGTITTNNAMTLEGSVMPGTTVVNNNWLMGSGTLGAVSGNGLIGGGSNGSCCGINTGSGVINLGNFAQRGVHVDLNGATAGSGYDQINVVGTVNIANASLNVASSATFAPLPGQEFVIVRNDGTEAVVGTFSSRPEGSIITVNAADFRITYAGGDGNDIVLICVSAPRTWTGAVDSSWSNAGNWNPAGVPAAGETLQFPPNARTATSNDLPPGRIFKAITFTGHNYRVTGNPLGITSSLGSTGGGNSLELPIDIGANAVSFTGNLLFGTSSTLSGSGSISSNGTVTFNGTMAGTFSYTNNNWLAIRGGVHSHAGTITTNNAMTLDGSVMPGTTVVNNNWLMGSGTLGAVSGTGHIGGGSNGSCCGINTGSGVLDVGNFTQRGVHVDLNGTTAGSGYDRINVAGTVNITNASLNVAMSASFSPATGQEFMIVRNDGTEAVTGTFSSRPEGSIITVNAADFRITYAGGDGNDIVLVCVSAPRTWTGAVDSSWSNAGNWNPAGVPAAGETLQFPPNARTASNNDLPSGRIFKAITFTGNNYRVTGNPLGITSSLGSTGGGNSLELPIDIGANAVSFTGNLLFGTSSALSGSGSITSNGTVTFNGTMAGAFSYTNNNWLAIRGGVHSHTGTITINNAMTLDGSTMPGTTVINNNWLMGNGTVGAVSGNGHIGGGSNGSCCGINTGSGVLDVGNFSQRGVHVDLNGPGVGTGYDSIRVTGTATITNASLNVAMSTSFVPSKGQVYYILDNDGTDPVVGTFSGRAEGDVITLLGYQFKLSYQGGSGNDVTLTSLNGKEASSITLSSSANPSAVGQTVTFTASVSGNFGMPTGSIIFRSGLNTLGTATLNGGTASITTAALTAGSHAISAEYAGDGTYGGSASPVLNQVVNALASGISLASSTNPSIQGNAVTLTATVSGNGGVPAGFVTFRSGTEVIGTIPLANGIASFVTSNLAVGQQSITAEYGGSSVYSSSVSTVLIQVVNPAVTAPHAPGIGTAVAGNARAWVTFTPPANNGGSAITGYTVISTPGGITASGSSSPIMITGLTNGTTYTFHVVATNGVGTSGPSAASNAVTPSASIGTVPNPMTGVQQVVAGYLHTCVLTDAGGVKCWGDNEWGQLGDGTFTDRSQPVDVVGLTSGVAAIHTSSAHTCAITDAGALKCWGYNGNGGLGVGDTVDRNVPTQVVGMTTGVQVVSAGNGHTCAIVTGGGVKCWGHGQNGRLGNGSFGGDVLTPPASTIALAGPAISVSAGAGSSCAVVQGGAAYCWGMGVAGQLGNGDVTDRNTPVPASGITSGAVGITVGVAHACARMADDRLLCWGDNQFGQLGDGSANMRPIPGPVSSAATFEPDVDVSTTWYHSCILTAAGGVKCWGMNAHGQLGDGTFSQRSLPVDVLGLGTDTAEVAAGWRHTCVRTHAGAVMCWGDNSAGQLGDGTTTPRVLPGPVNAPPAKVAQAITFEAPASPVRKGSSFTVSATASSNLAVAFTVSGPCSISGTTVTMTAATGICSITATQAGNPQYLPAENVVRTVDAAKGLQAITFGNLPASVVFGGSFTANATATSGLPVTIVGTGGCTVATNTATMTSGTTACTLTASQPGNSEYEAATDVVATVNAQKAAQTITFAQPSTPAAYNSSFTVSASSSINGATVSITASGGCSISGNTVTMTSGMTACALTASHPGNDNYAAASESRTVAALKIAQSITLTATPATAKYGDKFQLVATAGDGLTVDIGAWGACSISGGLVTITSGTGTCNISATQPGDHRYDAAMPVNRIITAQKAPQSITFAAPASPVQYNTSFTPQASASSNLPVAFSVSGVCSIAGMAITMTSGTGTCTVAANQAGSDNYEAAAAVTHVVQASKAPQTVSFGSLPASAPFTGTFPVSATSSAALPVSIAAGGACTIAGPTVTMTTGTGTCTLAATQPGNDNYAAANASANVEATRLPQAITFAAPASPAAYLSSFVVSANSSVAGLAVEISASGICGISGSSVTMTGGTGNCVLTATQGGNANYAPAAPVVRTVAGARIGQVISFGALADRTYGDMDFALGGSSSSGLTLGYASLTPAACSVSGNTVRLGNAGTCTIRAMQDGNENYTAAAPVEQSFTVRRRAVTVSADALSKFVGNADPAVLTYQVTAGSVVPGDGFSGVLTRAAGEAIGTYPIAQNTLALSANYDLGYVGASFSIVGVVVAGPAPVALGTAATVTATFLDTGAATSPSCSIDWRDPALATAAAGIASKVGGEWVCSFTRTYSAVGVYAPVITIVDADLGTTTATHEFVVVYDAAAGFVTGGGWITSPAGAYAANMALTGKATFGFVSKYHNGQAVPTGETQFQFKAADFAFKSVAYEWLVISGQKARYRGTGTVNGAGSYGFELTAIDGDGKGPDRFRLQVWDANRGNAMVYDNQMGAPAGEDPTTALGGGSIVIHR